MASQSFHYENVRWSEAEKRIARKAYDSALNQQCESIRKRMKQMLAKASSPADLWAIHDYLSEERRDVAAVYDYRYSMLLIVFARLIHDGWIKESDLAGLSEDKIEKITAAVR